MRKLAEFLPSAVSVLNFSVENQNYYFHIRIKERGFSTYSFLGISRIIEYLLDEAKYTPKQIKRILRVWFNMSGSENEINKAVIVYHKMTYYFTSIPFDKMYRFFELAHSKGIEYHALLNAIPRPTDGEHTVNAFDTMLTLIEKYNNSLFFNAVRFANYARVRNAENANQLRDEIEYIEGNIERYTVVHQIDISAATYKDTHMGVTLQKKNYTHAECAIKELAVMSIDENKRIYVSTKHSEISNIGSRTGCCFTSTGVAAKLVNETILNPLSAILTGRMGSDWFSMIWEIVVRHEGRYVKGLVLDNIEAHKLIDLEEIIGRLEPITGYGFILLGTVRNDIKQSANDVIQLSDEKHAMKKPYYLIGGEASFYSYRTYDDSAQMYVLKKRIQDKNYKLRNFKGITDRDLFLSAYIEKFTYTTDEYYPASTNSVGEPEKPYFEKPKKYNGDKNFLLIKPIKEASFILESDTDIIGYLISHELTKDVMKEFGLGFETEEDTIDIMNNLDKVLYISDVVITCFAATRFIQEVLERIDAYCAEKGYMAVAFSSNKYSRKFRRHFEKMGLKVIEETVSMTFKTQREF